jgi:hypothetical protein
LPLGAIDGGERHAQTGVVAQAEFDRLTKRKNLA